MWRDVMTVGCFHAIHFQAGMCHVCDLQCLSGALPFVLAVGHKAVEAWRNTR